MANFYQRYELSMSLNGSKIVHIARNSAGNVVFREPSEDKLKKAIDSFEEQKRRDEEEREKMVAQKAKAKEERKAKKLFSNKLQEEVQERKDDLEHLQGAPEVLLEGESEPAALEGESEPTNSDPKSKKSFWDKLK